MVRPGTRPCTSRVAPINLDELLRFQQNPHNVEEAQRLDLGTRIAYARAQLARLEHPDSWREFIGTLGADPLGPIAAPAADIGNAAAAGSQAAHA